MTRALTAILSLAVFLTANAGRGYIDPVMAASQYRAYPCDSLPALTPAPAGFTPFHIEHYGRHGSRWLIDPRNYDIPVAELSKAARAGKLTPLGREILAEVSSLRDDSRGRLGELTPLGATQHRDIARRMAANFPEIINDSARIDARSTVVIRCILSMLNEVKEFQAAAPGAVITTDASERDMHYMNFHDPVRNQLADSARSRWLKPFAAKHSTRRDFLGRLLTDTAFADSLDVAALREQLAEVGANMQSHPERRQWVTDLFTPAEIDDLWQINNASWLLTGGNTALTRNRSHMVQRHLLRDMAMAADTAAISCRPGANLRFGHETMVLSLAALLDLDGFGTEHNNLDTLAGEWRACEVFPMACNIQMVFYRPASTSGDILVKVLLNERETTLKGLTPVTGPYYRWNDLRAKINATLSAVPD